MLYFNRANREVAILCNHQRSVPKSFADQVGKLKGKMDDAKAQLKYFRACKKAFSKGRSNGTPAAGDVGGGDNDDNDNE
mgnify:CR=1 FL=1